MAENESSPTWVVALFEYNGESEAEISFKEGELILVDDPDPNKEWWTGVSDSGDAGAFPQSYVSVCKADSEDASAPQNEDTQAKEEPKAVVSDEPTPEATKEEKSAPLRDAPLQGQRRKAPTKRKVERKRSRSFGGLKIDESGSVTELTGSFDDDPTVRKGGRRRGSSIRVKKEDSIPTLENLDDLQMRNAEHRKKLVNEIVDTEKTYMESLEQLTGTLFAELIELQTEMNLLPVELFSLNSITGIILQYSKLMLEMLEPRVKNFTLTTCIGDIFIQLGDYMKIYTQYVKEYEPFMNKFMQCKQKSKVLREKLADGSSSLLSFESCLIVPVQRIPRYQLLLRDLLKRTDKEHPDYEQLYQALEKIEEVGAYINERQRFYENLNRVLELQQTFGKQLTDGTGITEFVRSHRRFVRQGRLKLLNRAGKTKDVNVYLLNDLLIVGSDHRQSTIATLSRQSNLGSMSAGAKLYSLLTLWSFKAVDIPDDDTFQNVFGFQNLQGQTDEVRTRLKASSPESKAEWMKAITDVIDALSKAISTSIEEEVGQEINIEEAPVNDQEITSNAKWSRGALPPEIAAALAEEQRNKRSSANVISLSKNASGSGGSGSDIKHAIDSFDSVEEEFDEDFVVKKTRLREERAKTIVHMTELPESITSYLEGAKLSHQTEEEATPSGVAWSKGKFPNEIMAALKEQNAHSSEMKELGGSPVPMLLPFGGIQTAPDRKEKRVSRRRSMYGTLRTLKPRSSTLSVADRKPKDDLIGYLYVRVLEARKLKLKLGGTINAFVHFQLESKEYQTPVSQKSVHPVWNDSNNFTFDIRKKPTLLQSASSSSVLTNSGSSSPRSTSSLGSSSPISPRGSRSSTVVSSNSPRLTPTEGRYLDVTLKSKSSSLAEKEIGIISIKVNTEQQNSRLVDKWFQLKRNNKNTGEIRLQLRFVSVNDMEALKSSTDQVNMADAFEDSKVESNLTLSEQRLVDYLSDFQNRPILGK